MDRKGKGVVGKPKAGFTFHYDTDSGAVSSVSDRNSHNHRIDRGGHYFFEQ